MKCPTCGAENDPGNRFCDQCGTPLEPASAAPQAVAVAAAPVLACPNCGAAVVPGQAFCDECGSALTISTPVAGASTNAPTVLAGHASNSMTTQEPVLTASDVQVGPVCPVCGHQNVAGDHFCDNCGAALTGDVAVTSATNSSDAPTMMAPGLLEHAPTGGVSPTTTTAPMTTPDPSEPPVGEPPTAPPPPKEEPPTPAPAPEDDPPPATPPIGEPPSGEPPIGEPPSAPISLEAETPAANVAAPAADDVEAPTQLAPVADTAAALPQADTAAADATYNAEHQRLTDEIARQEQIITQFEQMQTMFGAAAPPAVTQGLSTARDALSSAQTDLAALQPPTPAVDPAEVTRLNNEIAQQGQIIAQFEQMQTMFGAAAPPAVTQGLSDARAALSRAQDELVALGGASTAVATPDAIAPSATVAATATPSAADATSADPFSAPTVSAPTPAAPTPAAPKSARFVLEDNRELSIPDGKNEVIVGREDPISGIYPEIDLTTYGGETGGVSRQHAKLNRSNGDWTITDLNSTNYTRVDGARLEPNQASPLKDGTRVQFGRVAMTFHA